MHKNLVGEEKKMIVLDQILEIFVTIYIYGLGNYKSTKTSEIVSTFINSSAIERNLVIL